MKKSFTLIELLIVIAIIGILATLIIPKFTQITDDAENKVADYNANTISNFMTSYYAVNKAYPSNLHTGFKTTPLSNETNPPDLPLMDNIPPVIQTAINNGVLQIAKLRVACLRNKGIVSVTYGDGTDKIEYGTFTSGNMITDRTPPFVYALKFVATTKDSGISLNGTRTGTAIYVNGMKLSNYLVDAAWVAANNPQTLAHSEQAVVYGFFLSPATNMSAVFSSTGEYLEKSKASATPKLQTRNDLFSYPFVLFRMTKTTAEYLTTLTFSKDGTTFVQ